MSSLRKSYSSSVVQVLDLILLVKDKAEQTCAHHYWAYWVRCCENKSKQIPSFTVVLNSTHVFPHGQCNG